MTVLKTCSRCKQAKPLHDFKTDSRKPDGKASACKACVAVPKVTDVPISPSRALVRMFDSNDPDAWIARIAEEWRNSVEAIMRVGRSLIEAKAALPHGAFLQMLEDEELPFGASTAQRLMAVARDERLSNAAYLQYLPASWGTLYELTKLSDEEFANAIERRVIRPDMVRAEVELIRPLARRESSDGGVEGHATARPLTSPVVILPADDRGTAREAPMTRRPGDEAGKSLKSGAGVESCPSEAIATLPRDESGSLTPEAKAALAPLIKEIRIEKIEAKKERRAEREADWGRAVQSFPDKAFGVAIEDFEWDHEAWSPQTGIDRHPSMHYETATDAHTPEEIVKRCAERFKCLADDCILFKWSTIPHLAIAVRVLELQGFRYVTHLIWDKERPGNARGPGYWFTGEHEVVLVGKRGNVVAPATAHFRSRFAAPVGAHSEKPANIHEIIEYHWPSVPKVEFNARAAREGWERWGNQAPQHEIDSTEDAA